MGEGQNGRLYSVEVAVGDGEGKCGEITRALVNVLAANEGEAERMAVKVFENQGQRAKALGVGLRTKERRESFFVDEFVMKGLRRENMRGI